MLDVDSSRTVRKGVYFSAWPLKRPASKSESTGVTRKCPSPYVFSDRVVQAIALRVLSSCPQINRNPVLVHSVLQVWESFTEAMPRERSSPALNKGRNWWCTAIVVSVIITNQR